MRLVVTRVLASWAVLDLGAQRPGAEMPQSLPGRTGAKPRDKVEPHGGAIPARHPVYFHRQRVFSEEVFYFRTMTYRKKPILKIWVCVCL